MIILITGASHTGKTLLAQRLLERFQFPYLSIDHLKMGLIRSGQTNLTPSDDEQLTPYLWNIAKEIIKTAIENKQKLIVEGCYIPFDWKKDFEPEYLKEIHYLCLVMSEKYIKNNFKQILNNANAIENRINDDFTQEQAIADNVQILKKCQLYHLPFLLINEAYNVDDAWKFFI